MRLTFLGDIMVASEQLEGYMVKGGYSFSKAFSGLKGVVSDSDYVVANLETPVAGEEYGYTDEPYSFNTPKCILRDIKDAGIDMLQTANNHCLDRGVEGLNATMRHISDAGLTYVGTHEQPDEMFRILEIGGVKVAFLAATYGTNAFANHIWLKKCEEYRVDLLQRQELSGRLERFVYGTSQNLFLRVIRKGLRIAFPTIYEVPVYERRECSFREKAKLKKSLQQCRKLGAEVVIVLLHIGGQYNETPSAYTKKMCEYCRRCGADIVMANHEHVIHPFRYENNSESKFFCVYSLGNFLSSTGVLSEPLDKLAEYSVVWHADICKKNDGITTKYCFQLFRNKKIDGKIVSEPVYRTFDKASKAEKKIIIKESNVLLNRLYGTRKVDYGIKPIYFVEAGKST